MYVKETIIHNPSGLHAIPASEFIDAARQFNSHITIEHTGDSANAGNAKSLIMVLSLCFCESESITIRAEGPDEEQAVETLCDLIHTGFGEDNEENSGEVDSKNHREDQ